MRAAALLLALLALFDRSAAWSPVRAVFVIGRARPERGATLMARKKAAPKISPFDDKSPVTKSTGEAPSTPLELTPLNVELVLDEMRPLLQADGGNVQVTEIQGGVVRLELLGACGSCASSAMTMKMGLERRLRERIPSITAVVQVDKESSAPPVTPEEVDSVLQGVRPFLRVSGGSLQLKCISAVGDVHLRLDGFAAGLSSVKAEIAQRLQRHFKRSLRVVWE